MFDTGFSRTFSLLESQREFLRRFARKEEDKKALPMLASACPGNKELCFCQILPASCLQRLDRVSIVKSKGAGSPFLESNAVCLF